MLPNPGLPNIGERERANLVVPTSRFFKCISEIRYTLYAGMAPKGPLNLNRSELPNAAAISPFRYITWPTSVSIHDKTLNGGKIHCYNDIYLHEIAKTLIPSPSNSGQAEA